MLIAGVTVIWTRQKATGTGAVRPGGVKLFAAMELAVMETTSGNATLESLVQLSANTGAVKTAMDAASAAVKPQAFENLGLSAMFFLPSDGVFIRPIGRILRAMPPSCGVGWVVA